MINIQALVSSGGVMKNYEIAANIFNLSFIFIQPDDFLFPKT